MKKWFCFTMLFFLVFLATTIFAASSACLHSNSNSNCFSCHSKYNAPIYNAPMHPRKRTIPTVSEIRSLGGRSWLITATKEATKIVEDCYGPPNKKIRKLCFWDISSANHLRFCGFFGGDVAIDILGEFIVFTGSRVLTWDINKNAFFETEKPVSFSWRYEGTATK